MFVDAIEEIDHFTRPIMTISRTYNGNVTGGTGTFFFVNGNGVAVTCKHIAQMIIQAEQINQNYLRFKAERQQLSTNDAQFWVKLEALEKKFGFEPNAIIQMKHDFSKAFSNISSMDIHLHPTLDLAIIEFKGFQEKRYSSYAKFIKDSNEIKQGRTLCRLGFPFPEFTNFKINTSTDDIEWTTEGNANTPRFPIDGIITRFVSDGKKVVSIEMSTPGLRGQSGGPLFDAQGRVYGMQFLTSHLHLGFDIQQKEVIINGQNASISNHPFLHVGWCVHVEEIKAFLKEKNIVFYEE